MTCKLEGGKIMKSIRSKGISLLLAVSMIISVLVIPAVAAEVEDYPSAVSTATTLRTIWPSSATFYGVTSGVPGNSIDVKISYTSRDESSNSSGYYITGVSKAEIVGYTGWYAARNISITDIRYYSNNQFAIVTFTYEASVGTGYATYSSAVTIESAIGTHSYDVS